MEVQIRESILNYIIINNLPMYKPTEEELEEMGFINKYDENCELESQHQTIELSVKIDNN